VDKPLRVKVMLQQLRVRLLEPKERLQLAGLLQRKRLKMKSFWRRILDLLPLALRVLQSISEC
jgi:hypothetical protein